jgi:hypothetical protein
MSDASLTPSAVTVDSLNLPAGSYIVSTRAEVLIPSGVDYGSCAIENPSNAELDWSSATLDATSTSGPPLDGAWATVSAIAPVTTATGETITLKCWDYYSTAEVVGDHMAAIKVGSVSGTSRHAARSSGSKFGARP